LAQHSLHKSFRSLREPSIAQPTQKKKKKKKKTKQNKKRKTKQKKKKEKIFKPWLFSSQCSPKGAHFL
jgi:hypothetical protein